MRRVPGQSGLDAPAVVDLLAADHDARVPDAIQLRGKAHVLHIF